MLNDHLKPLTSETRQAQQLFANILIRTIDVHGKYSKTYSTEDRRRDFFAVYSELNLWLLIQFDIFLEILNPSSTQISKYMELSHENKLNFWYEFFTLTKSGYLSHTMFQVESFLHSIMTSLGKNSDEGYFKFTRNFLSEIGISDDQKHKILNAPAQMRNSLHNSGYANYNFEITLRGKTYKFVKGTKITFAGWDTIHIFIEELLDLLIEIIENPKVKKVKHVSHHSEHFQI